MHVDCQQCRLAAVHSKRIIRGWHYQKLCVLSSAALADGRLADAALWRARAVAFQPIEAVRRFPLGVFRRVVGR